MPFTNAYILNKDRYRKSFPGASSSFTSGYFCDVSTDTEGSVHSPKLRINSKTLHNPITTTRNMGYTDTPSGSEMGGAHQSLTHLDEINSEMNGVSSDCHLLLESSSDCVNRASIASSRGFCAHSQSYRPPSSSVKQSGGGHFADSRHCREPHYQFRKSNSMKLALNEDEEGYWLKKCIQSSSSFFRSLCLVCLSLPRAS